MRRPTSTIMLTLGMLAVLVVPASGDAVQHSQHLALHAVGDAPLHHGFVENIHAQGPRVYANEVYVLVGAAPRSTFDVHITAHPFDPGCLGPVAIDIPTATFTTNPAGNGQGREQITPADVAGFPPGTHGVVWTITDGTHTYLTACTPVTLD